MKTPPRAAYPRKLSPARRNRATLRRELARRQDTGTPVHETQRSPGAAHPADSVVPSDGDEHLRRSRAGHRSLPRLNRSTRPGRPPSRRNSHPRAAGTSALAVAFLRDAAALRICVMNRTCVRTIGALADGIDANRCTCACSGCCSSRKWLVHARSSDRAVQRELQRGATMTVQGSSYTHTGRPTRTNP